MNSVAPPRWIVRAGNRLLDPVSDHVPDLRADAVRRRAEWVAGLSDWGDEGIHARMEACCEAVRTHPNVSPVGRISAATYFHIHSVNRLKLIDLVKRHPEIREVPVEAPVFVVGWYRTGTTYLHNLLAADPAHRSPRTWELFSPVPGDGDLAREARRRKLRSRAILLLSPALVPELAVAHAVPLDGPEECFFLLENDFVSSTVYNTFQGFQYAYDLLEQDLRPTYDLLRLQLQALAWRHPRRRWVLKSPFHLWHLDALMHAFPDARIVFTRRCVTEALPSNCSLSAMTTTKFSRSVDLHELGAFWRRYYRLGMERAIEARAKIPARQQLDLPLARLGRDPVGCIEGIYEHFGMDFGPETAAAVAAKDREIAAQPRPGKHLYDPASFGLDVEALREEFAPTLAQLPAA